MRPQPLGGAPKAQITRLPPQLPPSRPHTPLNPCFMPRPPTLQVSASCSDARPFAVALMLMRARSVQQVKVRAAGGAGQVGGRGTQGGSSSERGAQRAACQGEGSGGGGVAEGSSGRSVRVGRYTHDCTAACSAGAPPSVRSTTPATRLPSPPPRCRAAPRRAPQALMQPREALPAAVERVLRSVRGGLDEGDDDIEAGNVVVSLKDPFTAR